MSCVVPWSFVQRLAVIVILTVGLDYLLFFLIPVAGIAVDHDACRQSAFGCTVVIHDTQTNQTTNMPMVKYPLFSVAVHEWLHSMGYYNEAVPSIASVAIVMFLSSIAGLIYFMLDK